MIHWFHETLGMFGLQSSAEYFSPLVEYVNEIAEDGDRDVVLTGHSLGGGLASVVGAITHRTSVMFSPPGIGQAYSKFLYRDRRSGETSRIRREFVHHQSVAVVPENDIVPMVDSQSGLVQRVLCNASSQAMENSCHMLEGTVCDILRSCGDHRGRFADCEFEFDLTQLLPWAREALITNVRSIGLGVV